MSKNRGRRQIVLDTGLQWNNGPLTELFEHRPQALEAGVVEDPDALVIHVIQVVQGVLMTIQRVVLVVKVRLVLGIKREACSIVEYKAVGGLEKPNAHKIGI